jgi:hypothetical protein
VLHAAVAGDDVHVSVIVGDAVLPDLALPLAAQGVQHGAVMYVLTGDAAYDDRALEIFRVRSQLDQLIRELRVAEAAPMPRAQAEAQHPAGDPQRQRWSGLLTQLLVRLDRLANLPQPLRNQCRRTCCDAAEAEELLDRIKTARTGAPRGSSASQPQQQQPGQSQSLSASFAAGHRRRRCRQCSTSRGSCTTSRNASTMRCSLPSPPSTTTAAACSTARASPASAAG